MKKAAALLVLFLLLGLCSCVSPLQEDVETEKPTVTEKPPETESMLNEMTTTNTAIAEPVSIVFMGEMISAPGYYPDLPDLYAPVLDDIYLYGEVSLRHATLYHKGESTQDMMQESEKIRSEIRQRGYLPYPGDGLGINGGYTLVDLDSDGTPELLILDNAPYYPHTPVIKSVFAIRNGQLVCIDNGSSEMNYTILAVDNIFYQCIDWRAAGYTDLCAFRLEAGMLEFTVISEARAALSFSDGDIPVPYWTKTENGKETKITEDAFYALLEQHQNPQAMALDFIPLHPDAVDPWSIPRPSDEPSVISIEYPAAYPDAPEAYKPILDALLLLEALMRREEYRDGEDLAIVGFGEYPSPRDSALGYALVDLNDDGVLELLLGTVEELSDAVPSSIFTLKNGQPILLKSFWSRSRGVVSADGTIYHAGSSGAAYTYLSSFIFDKDSTLAQLTDMRSDYSFSDNKPYYFRVIAGRNHYISEQEFFDCMEIYYDPPERMKLTVYPISS